MEALTSLALPSVLTSIGSNALYNVGADAGRPVVTIPASVTTIGGGALNNTRVDATQALPNLKSVGAYVFRDVRDDSLGTTIANLASIEYVGPQAFSGLGLTQLTLGSGLTNMETAWGDGGQFRDNQLASVTVPGSVAAIPDAAFYNNPLTTVVVGSGVTRIGSDAFRNPTAPNAITTLTLPDSITTIGDNAFNAALSNDDTSLVLPLQLTSIGNYAFANNNLESITIPAGVRTIGASAFVKMGPQTITYAAPVFSGLTPSDATADSAYTTTFGASGAALAVKSDDTLPAGLTLDSNTGVLSGTPTTAGTYTFRLVATNADPASVSNAASPSDSSPYTSAPITITVTEPTPTPTPTPTPPPTPTPEPTPTPTPEPTPTPTPTPTPVPVPTPVPPGEGSLVIDGVPAPVTVAPDPEGTAVTVSGGGVSLTVAATDTGGTPLPLAPDGTLLVPADGGVPMSGSGFSGGSEVGLFLFSDPINLGTVTANASGTATATAQIPSTVPAGSHTLQIAGTNSSGKTINLSMGITVTAQATINLDAGQRTKNGRHDRITATGTVTGIAAGAVLTPYIHYGGQQGFTRGRGAITVAADGTFTWTRAVGHHRKVHAYLTYTDITSNTITWARIR